jgi:hypothetical protein
MAQPLTTTLTTSAILNPGSAIYLNSQVPLGYNLGMINLQVSGPQSYIYIVVNGSQDGIVYNPYTTITILTTLPVFSYSYTFPVKTPYLKFEISSSNKVSLDYFAITYASQI